MPEMGGLEATELIRKENIRRQPIVIALTADAFIRTERHVSLPVCTYWLERNALLQELMTYLPNLSTEHTWWKSCIIFQSEV